MYYGYKEIVKEKKRVGVGMKVVLEQAERKKVVEQAEKTRAPAQAGEAERKAVWRTPWTLI